MHTHTLYNEEHYNSTRYDWKIDKTTTPPDIDRYKWTMFYSNPFYRNEPIEGQEKILAPDLLIGSDEKGSYGDVYKWEDVIPNLENYWTVAFPIISRLLQIDNGVALTVQMLGQFTNGTNLLTGVQRGFSRIGKDKLQKDLYDENYGNLIEYLEQKLQLEAYILATHYFIPIMQQQGIEFAPNYTLTPLAPTDPRFKGRDRVIEYANLLNSDGSVEVQTVRFKTPEDDTRIYEGGIYYYQAFEFTWPEN